MEAPTCQCYLPNKGRNCMNKVTPPAIYCHLHINGKCKSVGMNQRTPQYRYVKQPKSPHRPSKRQQIVVDGIFEYKDANLLLLDSMADAELFNMCQANKYYAALCNEDFFRNRITKRYFTALTDKPENMTWKNYYAQLADVGDVSLPFALGEIFTHTKHHLFNVTIPKNILNLVDPTRNPNVVFVHLLHLQGRLGDQDLPIIIPGPPNGYAAIKQFGDYIVEQLIIQNRNLGKRDYFSVDVRQTNRLNTPMQGRQYQIYVRPHANLKSLLALDPKRQVESSIYRVLSLDLNIMYDADTGKIVALVGRPRF